MPARVRAWALHMLEPGTEVSYKVTDYYNPAADRGLAWDDQMLGIEWRVDPDAAILSIATAITPRPRICPLFPIQTRLIASRSGLEDCRHRRQRPARALLARAARGTPSTLIALERPALTCSTAPASNAASPLRHPTSL